MYTEDTIAAIATPPGEGGIGIVRVSGPEAERIAAAVFLRAEERGNIRMQSHRLYAGAIRDPSTHKIFDHVLLTIMRRPHSYTGEDVVEIHCHGGAFLVQRILGLIFSMGARHAAPGEFTKRAFLNGKLDLTQAEAVLDLIGARTDKGIDLAIRQSSGEFTRWVSELREALLDLLAQIEAGIDFPEEEIELLERSALAGQIDELRAKIQAITNTYEWGRLFREGAKVCIAGRPNVGKSSLFNAIVGDERVIVTPIPGTTRDVIEESINLDGLAVTLWDTAGIRHTTNEVERLGVDLSREHVAKSEAVIAVLDGSFPLTEDDRHFLSSISRKKGLIAVNKSDLEQCINLQEVSEIAGEKKIVVVSAARKHALRELKECLRETILPMMPTESTLAVTNLRHKNALVRGERALADASETLTQQEPLELVAISVQAACDNLEELVGLVHSDDILERIFSKFCIGK